MDKADNASPLLIFDGGCGFCTSSAGWISGRWPPTSRAKTVPWQRLGPDGLAAVGLKEPQVRQAAYWVDGGGRTYRGHRAVGRALQEAGGVWRLAGTVVLRPPGSWVARPAYRLVSRYRGRFPGGPPAIPA